MSERLAKHDALIIDADEVVKQLQRPGEPVFLAMVERWGDRIIGDDGNLDRPTVAGIVFGDKAELDALNKMVHPAVRAEMWAQSDQLSHLDQVVVLDIPLLVEGGSDRRGASAVIVVDCPAEVAIGRLMEFRNFERADAEARIAAQATREDRLAAADFVVDNSGGLANLDSEIERCVAWLDELPQTEWPPPRKPKT